MTGRELKGSLLSYFSNEREVITIAKYIPFTMEQKELAASVDLEAFLLSRGEKLIPSGREKRLSSDHSITICGREWYDHAQEKGGNAISFVQRHYNLSFQEAMQMLLGGSFQPAEARTPEAKPFILPEKHSDMRRVFAYLTQTRGIDSTVISVFAHEGLIYEDAKYHNAVFLGLDENGAARHAHVRSTNSYGKSFRQNISGSDARYSFHRIGSNGSLRVFEAPIDLLSHISLYPDNWQENSYVACCGTSIRAVLKTMEMMPEVKTVHLCLDNDAAGLEAAQRMAAQLREQGLQVIRQVPQRKDWNEELFETQQSCMQLAGL